MRHRLALRRLASRSCLRCCGLHERAWRGKRLAVGFAPFVRISSALRELAYARAS